MRLCLFALALAAVAGRADVRNCVCDLKNPELPAIRACSLCEEAEKHPLEAAVFLVKDNDPAKPNRWLAVPRAPFDGANPLAQMTAEQRRVLWTVAIAKAKELWGDAWAIAMNGDIARRQCHAHVHIGKLLDGKETESGIYVEDPGELPAVADGVGLWFHPVGNRLHFHSGEQINETVLMR